MSLDEEILEHHGGFENNSFVNIFETDGDSDDVQVIRHSPYYDNDMLSSVLRDKQNVFTLFSSNIQSTRAKFHELKIFVQSLRENGFEFSAICLQETHLSEKDDVSTLKLQNYELIHQGYSCTSKGGLSIYLHKKFDYFIRKKLTDYENWEGQVIQIKKGSYLPKPIILGNFYRPPRELIENYRDFINEFGTVISNLGPQNCEKIITGDFNIDLLKLNEKAIIADYFDQLTNQSFYPKITLPTRFSNNHGTLIDNFFCKLTMGTLDTTSGILLKKISDHQPYFSLFNNMHLKEPPVKYITLTKNDATSINKFNMEIMEKVNSKVLNSNLKQDPNINYNILSNIIQEAKHKHMPTKTVKFRKSKHKKSPWITYGIINSINYRDGLYKKLKCTNPESANYQTDKINLKTYNTILKKSIRLAQITYYEKVFQKYQNDIKNTWKVINDILGRTKKKKSFPQLFKDNDKIITDKLDIANRFNSFYADIGPQLAQKIIAPQNKSFKNYLTTKHNVHFQFHNVNESTVKEIISKLKSKTSFGWDGLSTKLLKQIQDSVIKPLTLIINQMLNTGIFPDQLKLAKVCPIYKKEDENLFTNYRPISLLPAISKVFEKVVFKQIYVFFQSNKLFYSSQYGFRTQHSTEYATLEVIDRIVTSMDKNDIPLNVYIDLSKAFDTLDHQILLHKLSHYGINGIALDLMQSYLTNRKQYVEIENVKSETVVLKTGVPQGSILGPLLFLIYINDISHSSKILNFTVYADDTTLSGTLRLISNNFPNVNVSSAVNKELNNVNEWLKLNRLSLNISKTKYIIFHTPQRKIEELDLKIDDIIIERVKNFNFLGITINEHLTWNDHINKVSNKISKNIGILNNMKYLLPEKAKLHIYNSLIVSHLNFGVMLWGSKCDRVLKLQKKAVRIIKLKKYNAHTEPIFKELKILRIEHIVKQQELKFYFKFRNDLLPCYMQRLPLLHINDIHRYPTRPEGEMRHPLIKHEYARNFIRYSIPQTINNTPHCILDKIETHSLQGFSKYIKNYYIESYSATCSIANCYICSRNN